MRNRQKQIGHMLVIVNTAVSFFVFFFLFVLHEAISSPEKGGRIKGRVGWICSLSKSFQEDV